MNEVMMGARLARAREAMREAGLDCLVVTGPANRLYLSGFTGDNGILVLSGDQQFLLTDFRYMEQAREEAPGLTLRQLGRNLLPEFAAWLAGQGYERIGFEAAHWSLADYQVLSGQVPVERLAPKTGLVERLRFVKDGEEADWIARAAAITDRAWARLIPAIKEGVRERDLATELDYLLRREGADGSSFSTIVASGPRGALPHGVASDKRIARGELVVFDFGAQYHGYAADMTRTVAVGQIGEEERAVYRIVAEAQAKALAAVRPGPTGREIDAVAREYITAHGYGEFFGHGLGHAVGLEIHEEPRLSPSGEEPLRPGMAVTVEPGIYLPGRFGVRIEDLVMVTDTGSRDLTSSRKELLCL